MCNNNESLCDTNARAGGGVEGGNGRCYPEECPRVDEQVGRLYICTRTYTAGQIDIDCPLRPVIVIDIIATDRGVMC